MKLQGLNRLSPEFRNIQPFEPEKIQKGGVTAFENVFNKMVKDVNKDQLDANKATEDFLNGEDIEIHEVMIAAEKAKTSLDLLVEIRNKTLDMYKELTRIQI
ncbi:MAG TPA: flagellar hook-basal body complex protein FliE [Ignavibacteriales bacterium]|nr:flagellar hook-basal body complex protein FliE [Ignavibacteriales bacterium]HOL80705.1 flagellar hook-basal body complex protein FliE [Ignavibacteriales bacterium]HOM64392.1 flagellar hook-basal body complex protein FliE [Ignavibacteriales bacterium]HPD67180.1 flagellar hook-basal body complex protein FliE [Ignavibacteriales bacterium]HPP32962.1 flagellar hook-basal body complex protein FliE [Ignavibacteriales bacterium]